jgi:photosystem II stability/assembly factor-like uncharacterized protein
VRFADTQRGWLGVEDGILGTTDAGGSWHRQLTSERIVRVWSVDDTHAWGLAGDDVVYRSQDGEHWTAMPRTDPPIVDIDFVTPLVGWAIATAPPPTPVGQPVQLVGTLLATTDGGSVWRPVTTLGLWSVCFSGEREGLGASGKRIFRTADAGRSWTAVADLTINDRGPWYPTLVCADRRNLRVQITEPYAALSHVPYLLFATTDAGATWKLEASEGYTLGSTTPGGTLPLGSYPSLLGTLAGGSTWILTCSPPADVQDLFFLDSSGTVIRKEKAPFVACARGATFVDDAHGWTIDTSYALVGNDLRSTGRLMRTTDGGRTWVAVYPR